MQFIGAFFGWGMAVVFACIIVIPYLRGRRHLLTVWNFFILGSVSFFAVNAAQTIPSSYLNDEFRESVYYRFMITGVLFFTVVTVTYFWPMRKTPRVGQFLVSRLPIPTPAFVLTASIICLGLSLSVFVIPSIPIISRIMGNNASGAAIAATVFSFWLFLRAPLLPLTWYVVVPMLCAAVMLTLIGSIGRQPLLSLVLSIPFVLYWVSAKKWKPLPTLILITTAGFIAVVLLTGYSKVRHATNEIQDPIERALARIQKIPDAVLTLDSASKLTSEVTGQNAVWCSLVVIDFTDDQTLEQEPLFTLQMMVGNWIPREFWPEKPKTLGFRLPKVYRNESPVNWGPGVVGHIYHEGGWWMAIFYGVLLGMLFRNLDAVIINNGHNPFVLAIIAPVLGQFIALTRGDQGLFLFQIMGAFIYLFFVFWMLRTVGAQKYQHPQAVAA